MWNSLAPPFCPWLSIPPPLHLLRAACHFFYAVWTPGEALSDSSFPPVSQSQGLGTVLNLEVFPKVPKLDTWIIERFPVCRKGPKK